jgi:hypothetical protein
MSIYISKYQEKYSVDLKEYFEFIEQHRLPNKISRKTSYHHILPKSLFPEYKDLKIHGWNGVHLMHEDHRKAHIILALCHPIHENLITTRIMKCDPNDNYQVIKENLSKSISETNKGRKLSQKEIEQRIINSINYWKYLKDNGILHYTETEEFSNISRDRELKKSELGIHPWQSDENGMSPSKRNALVGGLNFQKMSKEEMSKMSRETNRKMIANGNHPSQQQHNKDKLSKKMTEKFILGTHPFQGGKTLVCTDKNGIGKRIPREVYLECKNSGKPETEWEWVYSRSYEAKRRKKLILENQA